MEVHERYDWDAGSRMHILDWVESVNFVSELRKFVAPIGFSIADQATYQPRGRHDHRESVLIGSASFLSSHQQERLLAWWLVHRRGARLPTWDLVVSARNSSGRPALVLVEAKAHAAELCAAGKRKLRRKDPEQQARSNENHEKIARAIAEANKALQSVVPGISLDVNESYQFANRIAFAWKLASLGIPVALIYLGFIGDRAIGNENDCFQRAKDWQRAFNRHTARCFPADSQSRRLNCGEADFWLLVQHLNVRRQSPDVTLRRRFGPLGGE
jgi:hypothetical protein